MRIDAGLDTGDILLQRELPVAPEDTAETISPRLAAIGAELTVETMRGLHSGSIHPRSQNHAHATLAPILKKTDGSADFSLSATEIVNRIRGFQPWPGVYTKFRGKTLQIWKARPFDKVLPLAQLHAEGDRLLVGCGSKSSLELLELQLEGKKRMSASDFLHGYRPKPAESLG